VPWSGGPSRTAARRAVIKGFPAPFAIPATASQTAARSYFYESPLAYRPLLALWALLLTGPLIQLAANLLAAWPGQHPARLRTGQVLRAE
jgi:hypothetical protein